LIAAIERQSRVSTAATAHGRLLEGNRNYAIT
jgi:hypothetical protein